MPQPQASLQAMGHTGYRCFLESPEASSYLGSSAVAAYDGLGCVGYPKLNLTLSWLRGKLTIYDGLPIEKGVTREYIAVLETFLVDCNRSWYVVSNETIPGLWGD